MPTYSYACTECEHRFDAQQAFTDDALTDCPQCGGRLRKLFGNVGVVFKGSGFYRTDARDDAKRSGGATRTGQKPASGGSTSGSSSEGSSSGTTATAGSEGSSSSGGSGSKAPAGSSGGPASSGSSGGSAPAAAAG
ncbi:MAG: hypothetical protein KQH57_13695 [Actinomycetales bacterium]|nr:hypothetical protein [Actinomycetales bacterium]